MSTQNARRSTTADSAKDVFLAEPNRAVYSMEVGTDDVIVSCACMQGWRATMEDAHAIQLNMIPGVHLVAVFDGHGGIEAALHAAENLAGWVLRAPSFALGNYGEALREAYIAGDAELCAFQTSVGRFSGTTAVSVIITKTQIFCANVGDSRAVLCRGSKSIDLSVDHKPGLRREHDRVVNAGGFITNGRVRGMLAMTRALGDAMLKRPDVKPETLPITPVPEVSTTDITAEDIAVILACDGIWDCVSSQEVYQFFLEESREHDDWALMSEHLCQALVAPAIHQFGTDNMTIVVIRFRQHTTATAIPAQGADDRSFVRPTK